MPDHPPVFPLQPDETTESFFNAVKNSSNTTPARDVQRLVYDSGTLAELESIFGRDRLMDLLSRLKGEITQRLRVNSGERGILGHDAHALLSVSGSLGFFDLSQRCSEMEQAYLRGADLDAPLEAARHAAKCAVAAIEAIAARA